mmetsp:Transcript_54945/g.159035  ORF Transcript_54945/g.159035 Transcript_54945/m.159035 type:complete len:273 (+) Transcript_54945:535-1353(+)
MLVEVALAPQKCLLQRQTVEEEVGHHRLAIAQARGFKPALSVLPPEQCARPRQDSLGHGELLDELIASIEAFLAAPLLADNLRPRAMAAKPRGEIQPDELGALVEVAGAGSAAVAHPRRVVPTQQSFGGASYPHAVGGCSRDPADAGRLGIRKVTANAQAQGEGLEIAKRVIPQARCPADVLHNAPEPTAQLANELLVVHAEHGLGFGQGPHMVLETLEQDLRLPGVDAIPREKLPGHRLQGRRLQTRQLLLHALRQILADCELILVHKLGL